MYEEITGVDQASIDAFSHVNQEALKASFEKLVEITKAINLKSSIASGKDVFSLNEMINRIVGSDDFEKGYSLNREFLFGFLCGLESSNYGISVEEGIELIKAHEEWIRGIIDQIEVFFKNHPETEGDN